jgi:hypothetical protein
MVTARISATETMIRATAPRTACTPAMTPLLP